MYGHWHDVQHMTVTHMDGPKAAWSLGCLKDMRAESNGWLKNRKVNWGHAFAIVDFYGDNGEFTVDVVQIIDGRTSIWGTLLESKTMPKSNISPVLSPNFSIVQSPLT